MQIPDTPAIWADFAHIRTVKGRKVCELIVEAPLEDLLEILKRLGNPVGADMIPVAIVPIDPNAVKAALDIKPVAKPSEAAPSGSSKPFSSLPLSQQAAIRCQDESFQKFIQHAWPSMLVSSRGDYAEVVRRRCSVNSRSDLNDPDKGQNWLELESQFQGWLTDKKYAGAHR